MELKLKKQNYEFIGNELLIVPYGIETILSRGAYPEMAILLIVPYGIETYVNNM